MTIDVIELAQQLIRACTPNPPGDETAAAAVVHESLTALGLPGAEVVALEPHRPNLVMTLDFGPGGRHLALSGHMDTKPVGDALWSFDPYAAEIHPDLGGDRLTGLGSADMKGAIAAMLVAAGRLVVDPPTRGTLSIVLTADEEDGAAYGAHHLASTVPLDVDAVVIGEPGGIETDFDSLHLVSRGIARMRVRASARQGHSSLSHLLGERNAGVDLARAVIALHDTFKVPIPPAPEGPGGPLHGWDTTLNTGLVYRGGVGYGVLPGTIVADTELRLIPGVSREDVAASMDRVLAEVGESTGADLSWSYDDAPNDWLPATLVDPHDPIAHSARAACGAALGTTPPDAVFPGTTDATWFHTLQRMPVLPALGPGLLKRCHGADEWVAVDAVRRSVELYEQLTRHFVHGTEEAS